MRIRTTAELAQLVHIEKFLIAPSPLAERFFEEWAACVFVALHRQFLLFTEAVTLFSIVVPADSVTDELSLTKAFVGSVSKAMLDLIEGGGPGEIRIDGRHVSQLVQALQGERGLRFALVKKFCARAASLGRSVPTPAMIPT